ncbi:MAG: hypothetical protein LBR20_06400 [Propionibacteriaceae bacterium]|jgi:hypothetical protein|nr:hypothetical protein [Propionibacteriaceae bacterium]
MMLRQLFRAGLSRRNPAVVVNREYWIEVIEALVGLLTIIVTIVATVKILW